jgi:hypothetical protein
MTGSFDGSQQTLEGSDPSVRAPREPYFFPLFFSFFFSSADPSPSILLRLGELRIVST